MSKKSQAMSSFSKFSSTSVEPNLKDFHPFGCPIYILEAPLQTRAPFPKWSERSWVGILLCHSPRHASSVPLVLTPKPDWYHHSSTAYMMMHLILWPLMPSLKASGNAEPSLTPPWNLIQWASHLLILLLSKKSIFPASESSRFPHTFTSHGTSHPSNQPPQGEASAGQSTAAPTHNATCATSSGSQRSLQQPAGSSTTPTATLS